MKLNTLEADYPQWPFVLAPTRFPLTLTVKANRKAVDRTTPLLTLETVVLAVRYPARVVSAICYYLVLTLSKKPRHGESKGRRYNAPYNYSEATNNKC